MEIDKNILIQYADIKVEIADLKRRIEKDRKYIDKIKAEGTVVDSVKGTRKDGTIGSIRIEGFPDPEYHRAAAMMKKRIAKLKIKEEELFEALDAVDDFIAKIELSELRTMFRLYYIDDLTWEMVAMKLNFMYPKRKIPYTKDSCRMRHDRYLEKI